MGRIALMAVIVLCGPLRADEAAGASSEELEAAKTRYRAALEVARKKVAEALVKEDAAVASKATLAIADKDRLRGELAVEKQALEKDGYLPQSAGMKAVSAQVDKDLKAERAACEKAFKETANRFYARDPAAARGIVAAEEAFFKTGDLRINPALLFDKELLTNPGCEDALVGKVIPGWKVVSGDWQPRGNDPGPFEGKSYFYAGKGSKEKPAAELSQDVALRSFLGLPNLELTFQAHVRSFKSSPTDATQVILELRDRDNAKALSAWDSGKKKSATGWEALSEKRAVPKEAGWIRVRLIAHYESSGNDKNNDGYFDSLSLKVHGK